MAQPAKNPAIKGLIGAVLLLVGVGGGGVTGYQGYKQFRSASWPSVPGTVISGTVTESSGRRGRTNYTPEVTYRYLVEGAEYTSNRVAVVTDSHSSESSAMKVISKYTPGSTVNVSYDPANHGFGVLETKAGLDTYLKPGMMVILAIIGFFMLTSALKRPKAAPNDTAATG